MPSPFRVLILFQGTWEDDCVESLRASREIVIEREGFDPMRLAGLLRCRTMNVERYVERLCATYRGRIDAVWSIDDMFGCLLAAVVAQRLGLPGTDPAAVVRAQHKLLFRQLLAKALPAASVPAIGLPWSYGDRRARDERRLAAAVTAAGLEWPLFCKPVRAAYSVMARHVGSAQQLAAHLTLPWRDAALLSIVNRPFDRLARNTCEVPCGADQVMLERPLTGSQVNVDGFVWRGEVHMLGLVDECMYPGLVAGARHFAGFTMPSRQPAAMQARLVEVATAVVRAIGFDHGLFNMELFVGADGDVHVIEINPRAGGQFATMYRAVYGIDLELLAMHLAAGLPPDSVPRHQPWATAAASLVFRRFDGRPGPMPTAAARAWLAATHPKARLWLEPCNRRQLRWEYRWLGSHRYAVLNLAADGFEALFRDGDECARRLFGVALPVAGEVGATEQPMADRP